MSWELVGQSTIMVILFVVVLVLSWGVYETAKQKNHERELALIEAKRIELPPLPVQDTLYLNGRIDPNTLTRPDGYDRTGDRGL